MFFFPGPHKYVFDMRLKMHIEHYIKIGMLYVQK